MTKPKLDLLRKVRVWVRVLPRTKRRNRTLMVTRLYRRKVDAEKACRKGELVMRLEGFYFPPR